MHRRTRNTLMIVAAVLLLLAVAVFLRSKAPPEPARLLPESDGIIYVNLKPIRAFFHANLKPPHRAPDYERFVEATGFDWERDLDQVAIGLLRMKNPHGPNGPVAYSMVLVGKLTGNRLNAWLKAHAASRSVYAGQTIYNIPSQGRTVRVAQIGYDMLAVSNTPTPEQIHSIIDRHRTAALPFTGSTLLSRHYHEVPLLSLAWGMGQIGLPFSDRGTINLFGITLPLKPGSTIVASLTPTLPLAHSLKLRVEDIVSDKNQATAEVGSLDTLLTMARQFATPLASTPANNGLKELLRTAEITQERNRVIVTASFPPSLFTGLVSSQNPSPAALAPTLPSPAAKGPKDAGTPK